MGWVSFGDYKLLESTRMIYRKNGILRATSFLSPSVWVSLHAA